MPMNCRREPRPISLSVQALAEIDRIVQIWNKCHSNYGQTGEWLFGEFSIADAMFAPVALRFHSYAIALDDYAQAYVQSVLTHPDVRHWMDAGRQETEVIEADER